MNRKLTEEEIRLWKKFTTGVQRVVAPLASPQTPESPTVPAAKTPTKKTPKRSVKPVTQEEINDLFRGATPKAPTPQANLSAGESAGVDGRTASRFRRGKMAIDKTLDLHGYNQQDALHAFTHFLETAQMQGARVVRIITGHGINRQGEGVLRAALPRWVNLPENRARILSFDQTRAEDGGQGAFLLLLRRVKE